MKRKTSGRSDPAALNSATRNKAAGAKRLHGVRIEDYALIGDCETAALVSRALIGRKHNARALFEHLLRLANDVELLAEEYDTRTRRMAGNFPQAVSHISLVHAAFTLSGTWKPMEPYIGRRAGRGK